MSLLWAIIPEYLFVTLELSGFDILLGGLLDPWHAREGGGNDEKGDSCGERNHPQDGTQPSQRTEALPQHADSE